jgi:hypothetical protein
MTNILLRPPCYGSPVYWKATSEECKGCDVRDACAEAVKAATEGVKARIAKLDKQFRTDTLASIAKRFQASWREDKSHKRTSDVSRQLQSWSDRSIVLTALKGGENPSCDPETLEHAVFACILDLRSFKISDVIYELRSMRIGRDRAQNETKIICEALVSVGVLRKEGWVYSL